MKYTPQQIGEFHKRLVLMNPSLQAKFEREYKNMTRPIRVNSNFEKVVGLLEQKFLYPPEFIDQQTNKPYYLYLKCFKASYYTVTVNGPFKKMWIPSKVIVDGFPQTRWNSKWDWQEWIESDFASENSRMAYLTKQEISYKDRKGQKRIFAKADRLDKVYLTFTLRDFKGFNEAILDVAENDLEESYKKWYKENAKKFTSEKFTLSIKNIIKPKFSKIEVSNSQELVVVDPAWHLGHTIRALYSFMDVARTNYSTVDGVTSIDVSQITNHEFYNQYINKFNQYQSERNQEKFKIDLITPTKRPLTATANNNQIATKYFSSFVDIDIGYPKFFSDNIYRLLDETFYYEKETNYGKDAEKIALLNTCYRGTIQTKLTPLQKESTSLKTKRRTLKKRIAEEGIAEETIEQLVENEKWKKIKESKNKIYTGIGTRGILVDPKSPRGARNPIPEDISELIQQVSVLLLNLGYTLRSGGANGTDKLFEKNVTDSNLKQIYTIKDDPVTTNALEDVRWFQYAEDIYDKRKGYGNFGRLRENSMKLLTRNAFQVLGPDYDNQIESDFVIYYADVIDGVVQGGTGQAVDIAVSKDIPTFNLNIEKDVGRLADLLTYLYEGPKKETIVNIPAELKEIDSLDKQILKVDNEIKRLKSFVTQKIKDSRINQIQDLAKNKGKNRYQIELDIKELEEMKKDLPNNLEYEYYKKKVTQTICLQAIDIILQEKNRILKSDDMKWQVKFASKFDITKPRKITSKEVVKMLQEELSSLTETIERVFVSMNVWQPISVVIVQPNKKPEVKTYYNTNNFLKRSAIERISKVKYTDKIVEGIFGKSLKEAFIDKFKENNLPIQDYNNFFVKHQKLLGYDDDKKQIFRDVLTSEGLGIQVLDLFVKYDEIDAKGKERTKEEENEQIFFAALLEVKIDLIQHLRELDILQAFYDVLIESGYKGLTQQMENNNLTYLYFPHSETTYLLQSLSGKPISIGEQPTTSPLEIRDFVEVLSNLQRNQPLDIQYNIGSNLLER